MGVAISRTTKSADKAPVKRGAKSKGVVVTKTAKGLKLTDNGVVKLQFKVVSKTEMKQYKHPMYKPLLP